MEKKQRVFDWSYTTNNQKKFLKSEEKEDKIVKKLNKML